MNDAINYNNSFEKNLSKKGNEDISDEKNEIKRNGFFSNKNFDDLSKIII